MPEALRFITEMLPDAKCFAGAEPVYLEGGEEK
jgi:hypothetical protein